MYKLVALDLDGTLLTDELQITPNTISAIQEVIASGVVVTIATGRMFPSAKKFAEQLKLNVPLITYQGAIIKDVDEKKVWFERPVSLEISKRLIEFAREHQVHVQVYQDDILYVAEDNEKIQKYGRESNVPYTIVDDLSSLATREFTKVLFIGDPMDLDRLQFELQGSLVQLPILQSRNLITWKLQIQKRIKERHYSTWLSSLESNSLK